MARLRKYEILLKSFSLGDILVETYNTWSFNGSDFSAVFFFFFERRLGSYTS